MESQMQRPEDALHSGESNQSGEKKSMLTKVKDKAKKLKHTIIKQGHGQGQEHEYRYDDKPDEEEEADDDDEVANDRDIHGAPTHDSTVIKSTNLPMQQDTNSGNPTDTREDRFDDPMVEDEAKGDDSSKVPDPTGDGDKEAGVDPLTRSFDNLNVDDKSETKPSCDSDKNTMTGKVSSATSAITSRAISAKNAVASRLGYGGDSEQKGMNPSDKPESESTPGYTQKITGTLNPVYEKVAGAGTAVLSKFQGSRASGQEGVNPSDKPESGVNPSYNPESGVNPSEQPESGVNPSDQPESGVNPSYNPESGVNPSDKPESGSTPGYTKKITETLNPVYEKVAGAGTAVMSKFQGKGSGQEGVNPSDKAESGVNPSDKPESGSTPGYTKKITDTLNPVYEKVAGAGTAVMSKFQGSGVAGNQGGDAAAKGTTDKGVSMKDYLAEKLKPGDEDKALSEAITDALHKKKEGYMQKPGGEEKPTGKVTESEEVATHLGTGTEGRREGEDAKDAGRESSGPGVVGRVKDAVGSWIGKGTGTQTAQDSINESYVDKSDSGSK